MHNSRINTVVGMGMASVLTASDMFSGSGLLHKRRLTNTPKYIKKAKAKVKKSIVKKSKQINRKTK